MKSVIVRNEIFSSSAAAWKNETLDCSAEAMIRLVLDICVISFSKSFNCKRKEKKKKDVEIENVLVIVKMHMVQSCWVG